MRARVRVLLTGMAIVLPAVPAAADQIYSVFYDNRFGTVDDSTGAYTQIGTLPLAKAAGIAYDNGDLYAQSTQSALVTINPVSGAASVIGSSGLQLSSVGFAGGMNGLFEIDYASNLYSINPDTGAATLIGATGLRANNGRWDTSLSDDGTNLYFTAGRGGAIDQLYEINTATGLATRLGSTGVSRIAGSAIVDGDLELFQYHWRGGTDHIYSAPLGSTDFTAGAVLGTQIVDGGTPLVTPQSFNASASSTVPEPISLVLLGAGLIGLAFRGRRRRPPN
ncbi:MAG: PEP-CTERM sorting domain-containing protein [Bryobacteraceae bacterium]